MSLSFAYTQTDNISNKVGEEKNNNSVNFWRSGEEMLIFCPKTGMYQNIAYKLFFYFS